MKTKSGKHIIFDITEFLPGKKIPADYFPPNGICDGPWYFMPADWQAPRWCGTNIGERRGFPMAYSAGHATPEEALAAAERWEAGRDDRQKSESDFVKFINND